MPILRLLNPLARAAVGIGWLAAAFTFALAKWPEALRGPSVVLGFALLITGIALWLARFVWAWSGSLQSSSSAENAWPGAGNLRPMRFRNVDFFGINARLIPAAWLLASLYVYYGGTNEPGSLRFWTLSAVFFVIGAATYTRTIPPASQPKDARPDA